MANTISTLQSVLGSQPANATQPVESTRPAAQGSVDKTAAAPSVQVHATDHANVSTAGGLVSQASSGSDVRLEKVTALQHQIASGSYHVPASAVAGKIVDSLLS